MRPISIISSSLLLVAASACGGLRSSPVKTIPDDRALPASAQRPSRSSDASARETTKRVTSKEEPATLIAADRTQCLVGLDEFRRIRVGDEVACVWSPVGRRERDAEPNSKGSEAPDKRDRP